MKAALSVRVQHREVFRSEENKISMVSDITSLILRKLDESSRGTEDWTRMVIIIDRE